MRRASLVLALVTCMLTGAAPAAAETVHGHVTVSRGESLPTLGSLEATATASADAQAINLSIGHTDLGHLTAECSRAAEIVGAGPSLQLVFAGFRSSPTHWAALSDPGWTAVGGAAVQGADGALYVSVVFCAGVTQSASQPPPSPSATEEPPSPAPSPPERAATGTRQAATLDTGSRISIDVVGLITSVLSSSLDSLTAVDNGPVPMVHRINGGPTIV